MAKVKVFHDTIGNTLVVWFDEPEDEYEVEETGDEVILMKNREGRVIGFEKLNFVRGDAGRTQVDFEAITVN
ncbi:MAG: DUF2283 domain-containing protein [Roseofilum sp. SBFL]|uniref:DUF2283 domain-containing protein n=1 Tax=unclassified Roseofilum TaxID=2620099 RepID=UPI001B22A074|nr:MULTISPECIES: DUF2283 domain-containing protein [unclassified Roseofilum]MBP0014127.1 DUF2283 domain-containing protein [Roseofilum sp. SID3]MBP0024202.1 DUF2283 domain-containing protein [Roseofilum sp. SID2]MBP0042412.1 DUF2283 domain-containing protein [Roseofilum sp. SBFL]